ncbi:Rhamnan synthesis F [Mesorhizobium plurifarium]|uniref:Rhamnan synthesis F n=1 Tax=Mesorhizobium plurifarium TaxID=69974 RepID=A0A090FWQ4_MESPL|nr:Rhamnan synthesis F [Mesorhizobium plurifarium]
MVARGVHILRTEGFQSAGARTLRFLATRRPFLRVKKPALSPSFLLFNKDGATNARRPLPEDDIALRIPLPSTTDVALPENIAVIVHAFYVDVFQELILYLKNIGQKFQLYVSTSDEIKKKIIIDLCLENGFDNVEVRIFENRGRDIAPKIIGFSDIYEKHEIFLHLHTKKSPHLSLLQGWRDYLLGNLVGSTEVVRSILALFSADQKLGVVYPQHFYPIRGMLNWGFDFETAQALLAKAHWSLSKDSLLEFPSGSMFWGRSAALKPLLDLGLTFDDFPIEAGQVDGTLAHAIERSYLHFAECAGFHWLKVQNSADVRPQGLLTVEKPEDSRILEKVYLPLFEEPGRSDLSMGREYAELRPLRLAKSNNRRPRLNLLLPTIDPLWVFGGISTALKTFDELSAQLLDFDKRIVVLDSPIEPHHLDNFQRYKMNSSDGQAVVFEAFNRIRRMDVRRDDVYISTAWWSEYLRTSIGQFQEKAFGSRSKAVYFIQDYESNFIQWSSRWAIAESTYGFDENVAWLVNSEELSSYMSQRFGRTDQMVVPFRMNETIKRGVKSLPKERIILCYGRPTAARNCFEIVVDGLSLWQQRNPIEASKWQVVFLGENFDTSRIWPVQNGSVPGKVGLEEYAEYLSRASVGVSLMISPHPSYPPLEMAYSGLITISNNYDAKEISNRSENFVALDQVTPDSLALAMERSVKLAEEKIGRVGVQKEIAELPFVGIKYDPWELAEFLRKQSLR